MTVGQYSPGLRKLGCFVCFHKKVHDLLYDVTLIKEEPIRIVVFTSSLSYHNYNYKHISI